MKKKPVIAIVDYGMGNLFSVKQACEKVGLDAIVTRSVETIGAADAIILPGVGAFGDAISSLTKLDLVSTIKESIGNGNPFFGICLGFQLLFSESYEFGTHKGLDIVSGKVVPLRSFNMLEQAKVPHVGWNRIYKPEGIEWDDTVLSDAVDGEYYYFVHSLVVKPLDKSIILSTTEYEGAKFCSSIQYENIYGFQFHPERSGKAGLVIYKKIKECILGAKYEQT